MWWHLVLLLFSQKAWSGLSPTRNPVHLRLWGLSFPSVESQLEPLFFCVWWVPGQTQSPSSLGPKVRIQTHGSPRNASWVCYFIANFISDLESCVSCWMRLSVTNFDQLWLTFWFECNNIKVHPVIMRTPSATIHCPFWPSHGHRNLVPIHPD